MRIKPKIYVGMIYSPERGDDSTAKEFTSYQDAYYWCLKNALPWDRQRVDEYTVTQEYWDACKLEEESCED